MDNKYLANNRSSYQKEDDEDVFSIGNEGDNVENKSVRRLIQLECDDSLSVSSDLNDYSEIKAYKLDKKYDSIRRIDTPNNKKQINKIHLDVRKSEEILKIINDTSG